MDAPKIPLLQASTRRSFFLKNFFDVVRTIRGLFKISGPHLRRRINGYLTSPTNRPYFAKCCLLKGLYVTSWHHKWHDINMEDGEYFKWAERKIIHFILLWKSAFEDNLEVRRVFWTLGWLTRGSSYVCFLLGWFSFVFFFPQWAFIALALGRTLSILETPEPASTWQWETNRYDIE